MIRVGLIGCGFMGGMHAACYAALAELGVKVTAIADDRPEFLAQMKEQTDAQTYESGMALIEQADVDVVDICLPTYLHTAHACAAMEKGRDVFCEKPVCLTEEDMQALLETKKRTGCKVMVGQAIRLWDEYAWLKKTVDAGTYGRVLSGVFQRVFVAPRLGKPQLAAHAGAVGRRGRGYARARRGLCALSAGRARPHSGGRLS